MLKTDQHLFFNGEELLNEDATLQALGIPQGAHLLLKVGGSIGLALVLHDMNDSEVTFITSVSMHQC